MSQTAPTTLPSFGTAPSSASPSNFDALMDAFLVAMANLVAPLNSNNTISYNNAVDGYNSAVAAAASAAAALASAASSAANAAVVLWVSGSTYSSGACVYSPITFLTYRRTSSSPGSSITDPSADGTRWVVLLPATFPVTIVSTTSQTALAGNEYVLTNVAATTVTLPASPNVGDKVIVKPANGLATNIVNPNGATIEGVSGNMTIDNAYAVVNLQYLNGSWRLV